MLMPVFMVAARADDKNPLLGEFDTPHGTPPFDKIKIEHWMPALEEGIRLSREEVDAIASNPEAPTFENTIEALERQGELLDRTSTLLFTLKESETSPALEDIAKEIMPRLTELGNYVSLNPVLFERVKAVYDQTYESGPYDDEQKMLLLKTYKRFSRSGAGLSEQDKKTYNEITTELATLSLTFGRNVLDATNAFSLNIPPQDSARVAYMPEFVRTAMAEEAAEKGQQGWTVTLQIPSYLPFMIYSRERDLKEQLWRAYGTRAHGGEYDNDANIRRLAELKLKLANLLGYKTYADYVLEERMAGSLATVDGFLEELLASTKQWAMDDYEEVKRFAARQPDGVKELKPWDITYYEELYKKEKFNLDEERVKPYFKLENVQTGVFMLAEKLFGLTFKPNAAIPVYHPDVKAFEVYDADGSFLAVLYMDYFPRATKRGGAWMTNYRDMYTTADGREVRPVVTLNFNFTKPTADAPSLLTFDEAATVMHEFGHGLHGMLAKGRYGSLTGTSVYRDFVEFPSQLIENWMTRSEFLDLWATHYQTGEKIPQEIVDAIIASKNYMSAYGNIGQLKYAVCDMAWHTLTEPYTGDVAEFERKATERTVIVPPVPGVCFSTSFSHIFAGGYGAGYYSYKWSEVLEADAFRMFEEKGIFNPELGKSYRENILEKGGSRHPMELYIDFRGHKPETKALIDKIGEGR